MNDQISWEASLVKKFSSSNHYKLLNQLRNEVKKYPLNNKRNLSSNKSKDINDNNNISTTKDDSITVDSNTNNEKNINKSNVSFNNSKNFSIYNNVNNDSANQNKEKMISEGYKSNDDITSSTFKDRLNQVDMK